MAYVYRHTTLDTNEVFYIGIGLSKNYRRAYSKCNRNKLWRHVVNKHGYAVDILLTDLSWEEACDIEKHLISKIGRRDIKTGSLVNMTDGGDGVVGLVVTDERREKQSKALKGRFVGELHPMYGKKLSDDVRRKMSESSKGYKHTENTKNKLSKLKSGDKNPMYGISGSKNSNSKLVLDKVAGIFYDCTREAAEALGIPQSSMRSYLNGNATNKTNLVYA